jgi:hypothetical protein
VNGLIWRPKCALVPDAKEWIFFTNDTAAWLLNMELRNWSELYELQDLALARLRTVNHGFYLSGGTALSRGYYEHRYSEDLDLFVNDAADFELWRDRCLESLRVLSEGMGRLEIILREERFGRAFIYGKLPLKIEFLNDVPFRVGSPISHPTLGSLDTKENILANKISALVDRREPKDIADIFWLCCQDTLDIRSAVENAEGKAAGIFPPLVARVLTECACRGVPRVSWRKPPKEREFLPGIESLVEKLIS